MTNYENSKQLFEMAEQYMEELKIVYERKMWNIVVRKSQEVVELCLKGLLKLTGVDFPKTHDIGDVFIKTVKEKNLPVDEKDSGILLEIPQISQKLADWRSPAFYFERVYSQEEAEWAFTSAEEVYDFVNKLRSRIEKCS